MLLKMSLSGGILIILIIILRHLLINHLPGRVFVLLWDIALLRLLIPFDLPLEYGISLPVFQNTGSIPANHAIPGTSGIPSLQMKIQDEALAVNAVNKAYNINLPLIIWITGTVTLFTIFALLYLKEYRIMSEALPVTKEQENNLRQAVKVPYRIKLLVSDRISTPVAFGIIHPAIIFPKLFKPDNMLSLKYITTHEIIHIKRADNLWKIIILSAICIHWFNPLTWIMYILFNRDLEISCDEKVLSIFGDNAKKDYAMALVNFAENQCKWQFFSNGFGKKPVQERIEAIMKYKKLTVPGAICAAILLGTAVTVFAKGTAPEENNKEVLQKNISKMENLLKNENSSGATPSAIYHCYEGENNDLSYFVNTEEFKEYEKYGLSYNKDTGHLMYDGKITGYFFDETSKGVYTRITDEDGTIGLIVTRNANNEITGFKKTKVPYILEPDEYNPGTTVISYALDDAYAVSEDNGTENASVTKSDISYATSTDNGDNSTLLKDYEKYGITYNKSLGMWQYKGKDIAGFYDEGKMLLTDNDTGKNSIYIIIDGSGAVKEVSKKEFNKIFNE